MTEHQCSVLHASFLSPLERCGMYFLCKFPLWALEDQNVNKFHCFSEVEMQVGERIPPATAGGKYLLFPQTRVFVLLTIRKEIHLRLSICGKLNS